MSIRYICKPHKLRDCPLADLLPPAKDLDHAQGEGCRACQLECISIGAGEVMRSLLIWLASPAA